MKKILLVLFSFVTLNSFAQDIAVTVVQPAASSTLVSGQPFNFTITVSNVGSVDLTTSDSVIIGLYLNNTIMKNESGQNLVFLYKPTTNLVPGFARNVSVTGGVTANITSSITNANFCVIAIVRNGTVIDASGDNTACQVVNTSTGATGVNQENFTLSEIVAYPNPTSNSITITHNLIANSGKIVITDITGKQVSVVALTNDKTDVDVTALNNGIYVYQVIDAQNNLIKSDKFIVTR